MGAGHLRFILGPDGRPTGEALVRGDEEVWRATRRGPEIAIRLPSRDGTASRLSGRSIARRSRRSRT